MRIVRPPLQVAPGPDMEVRTVGLAQSVAREAPRPYVPLVVTLSQQVGADGEQVGESL